MTAWKKRVSGNGLWSAKAVAFGSLALVLSIALPVLFRPSVKAPTDFFMDYASARNLLSGKRVYRPLDESFHDYLGQKLSVLIAYDGHPPTSILLAVPVAWTDYVHASIFWNWLSLLALAVSARIIMVELKYEPTTSDLMLLLVALTCWPPLWSHLASGQFGCFLLLLLTLAWSAERRGNEAQAGCLIGLAAAVKLFPAVLLLHFVFRRKWRAVAFGIASFLSVAGLTLVVVGFRTYQDYIVVLAYLSHFHSQADNASLTGFFRRLSAPQLSWWLIAVSSAAVLATIWSGAIRKTRDSDGKFGITLNAALLLSTITWQHSFVMLLLPLAICATHFSRADAGSRFLLIGSWILMAVPEPLLPGFSVNRVPAIVQSLGIFSMNFYGLLAFFVAQTRFGFSQKINKQNGGEMC